LRDRSLDSHRATWFSVPGIASGEKRDFFRKTDFGLAKGASFFPKKAPWETVPKPCPRVEESLGKIWLREVNFFLDKGTGYPYSGKRCNIVGKGGEMSHTGVAFRGRYTHAIDTKGRVSIPSKFREVLAGRGQNTFIITNDLDPCLVAYPLDEWFELEKKLQALPSFLPEAVQFRRFFLSGAQECTLDGQGRILIPASLREHAQLEKEALFVGLIEKFEIWSPALWRPKPENVEKMRAVLTQYLS
jgi:MraZ protein